MAALKRCFLIIGVSFGFSSISKAGPVTPPAGQYILNVGSAINPAVNLTSATFNTQVSVPFLTNGQCVAVASGRLITQACGSGTPSYTAPAITLATVPSGGYEENGSTVVNVALGAFTVENSSPIWTLVFKRNGSTINTVTSPPQTGGTSSYVDTSSVTANATYTAVVGDSTTLVTSNSITFTFVYPTYYGVGAQALTGAQVQALTKLVQPKTNTTTTTSPSNQVYYFAYPTIYGSLISILDTNGFQTLAGYTQRTATLTMLDGSSQGYYIYEFNTPTTQTNFNNTYKFN